MRTPGPTTELQPTLQEENIGKTDYEEEGTRGGPMAYRTNTKDDFYAAMDLETASQTRFTLVLHSFYTRFTLVLHAAISPEAKLVCCSGASFNLVQLIDNSALSRLGVQRLTTFDKIAIRKLMHKDSHGIFGRKDVFLVLQYLGISLGGQCANGGDVVYS